MTIRKRYIDGRFGQMHICESGATGTDKVPLVCFHMSPFSGTYYQPFQLEMSRDRLVICPDTPGYGGSDAPDKQPDMSDYALAMTDMLDELALDQVDLLGFHTGVFVATELAVQQPHRVRKLVLPGVPYFPPAGRAERKQKFSEPRPYFNDRTCLDTYWGLHLDKRGGESDDRYLALFADSLRCGLKSHWGYHAVFSYDAERQLPQVKQPVLLPVLDEMLAQATRDCANLFPNGQLIETPELKADAFECDAQGVAAYVRPFLDTL